jgi:hypothetical protein
MPCSAQSWTDIRIIRIHIRAISTTGPHPLARQSLLRFTINADPVYGYDFTHALLQLAGNTLMLYFRTPSQFLPTIHIWDWTTSDLLVVRWIFCQI